MLVPDLDTPEGLFGWMAARGIVTPQQALEMIDAVRRDEAEADQHGSAPDGGPCNG